MRLFRPTRFARLIFPDAMFRIDTRAKLLCLTFDDGPDPATTPELIEILDRHGIKSIFFCRGQSAEKYPGLISLINSHQHLTGNHGYSHLDGWKTSFYAYCGDVKKGAEFTSGSLFRPPYGRMKLNQYRELKKDNHILLWDLMPYDFDSGFGAGNSLRILKDKIRPGSIIVLHDTPSSSCLQILEQFILYAKGEGYGFAIPQDLISDTLPSV